MEHTKWKVIGETARQFNAETDKHSFVSHFVVTHAGIFNKDEIDADVNLIAAAPELLEALQTVLPYLKASGTNGNYWAPVVENAIKKATL